VTTKAPFRGPNPLCSAFSQLLFARNSAAIPDGRPRACPDFEGQVLQKPSPREVRSAKRQFEVLSARSQGLRGWREVSVRARLPVTLKELIVVTGQLADSKELAPGSRPVIFYRSLICLVRLSENGQALRNPVREELRQCGSGRLTFTTESGCTPTTDRSL
jgi:hypothetical protein